MKTSSEKRGGDTHQAAVCRHKQKLDEEILKTLLSKCRQEANKAER